MGLYFGFYTSVPLPSKVMKLKFGFLLVWFGFCFLMSVFLLWGARGPQVWIHPVADLSAHWCCTQNAAKSLYRHLMAGGGT